jgi:hypothetical protein
MDGLLSRLFRHPDSPAVKQLKAEMVALRKEFSDFQIQNEARFSAILEGEAARVHDLIIEGLAKA